MALLLRRKPGEALLVLPFGPHSSDEVTTIRIRDVGHDGSVGFSFDTADNTAICLDELYGKRHSHELIKDREVGNGTL